MSDGRSEWPEECRHYYSDPSGGFGWPSCVKCGEPVPSGAPDSARSAAAPAPQMKPCVCETPERGPSPVCPQHGHLDGMRRAS